MHSRTNFFSRHFLSSIFLLLFLLGIAGGFWWRHAECDQGIYPYESARDRGAIIQLFDKNWHWLVSESSLGFSPEYMLDHRASSRDVYHEGNLDLFVYRACDKTVGFLAYFRKSLVRGQILFVVVDEEYRGRGYARKLLMHGVKNLVAAGMPQVELVTRLSNTKARSLYESAGFKEIWRDAGFIRYEYLA